VGTLLSMMAPFARAGLVLVGLALVLFLAWLAFVRVLWIRAGGRP
jgi:hypothetical protein